MPVRSLLALLASASLLTAGNTDPARYVSHVKFLASPELKGRGSGTPELEKAAAYIVKQFRKDGLKPVAGNGYEQPFSVTVNAKMGPKNHLGWTDGAEHKLKVQEDFNPFNFSASGTVNSSVVFAGYGITANEYHYDDYASLDVKGKIVLVLRHEPQENDDKSQFNGKALTMHAGLDSKAANAKIHGAAAVVIVNDLPNHPGDEDAVDRFARTVGPNTPGIPIVQIRVAVADEWLAASGKNLKDLVAGIDKELKPQSFALPATLKVAVETDVERQNKTVHNIAAYLPGETSEYVIIGAHYDHLGFGEQNSLATGDMKGKAHPGADDNASGTAGMLELARYFSSRPKPKRGFLFLAFSAEELGLLGSSYYVNHPELPLDKCVTMINLDMIGRIRDGKVYVGGSGTGSTFQKLLEEVKPKYKLSLDLSEQAGYGSSDHASFTPRDVPVLFFFSGLHADYHRPTDTWEKIDANQAVELLDFVAEVATRLSDESDRPKYVRIAPPRPAGGSGGYGAWFGSMPDFAEVPNGFRFADIMPNSPAMKAGLKAGDVLFEFDGRPIGNLYDFTAALRTKKPGDTVAVKVHRGSDVVETKVTLERRR